MRSDRTHLSNAWRTTGAAVLLAVLTGCQSGAPTSEPMDTALMGNDPDAQMEFWHKLPEQRLASNDQALHALLLFVDGSDPAADYDTRVQMLKDRQMLPEDFNGAQSAPVKRGTIAVALARALEIRGGLTMRLLGPSPRYAVRELQYMNLFPPSSPQQTFSGQELLGIIGRAEDYQRMFNEDALADGSGASGPGQSDAAITPESVAPDSEPQQP